MDPAPASLNCAQDMWDVQPLGNWSLNVTRRSQPFLVLQGNVPERPLVSLGGTQLGQPL